MQKRMCQKVLGSDDFENIEIAKTTGKKPFLLRPRPDEYPNFNYNVSHEGLYVVCASEKTCICGVDVAAPQLARQDRTTNLKDFRDQLTDYEWHTIHERPSDQQYEMFQRFWSCKEAFVKARGDGLAFPLKRVECNLEWVDQREENPIEVFVTVDGKRRNEWRLYQCCLPGKHWVTIARGPIAEVQDGDGVWGSTFARRAFTPEEWEEALTEPMPLFEEITLLGTNGSIVSCTSFLKLTPRIFLTEVAPESILETPLKASLPKTESGSNEGIGKKQW